MIKWVHPSEVESFKGLRVTIKAASIHPDYQAPEDRTVIATGGFGCDRDSAGRAVFVLFPDGYQDRFNRSDIESVEVIERGTENGY